MTKKKRAKNRITRLHDTSGNMVEDEEGLAAIATSDFMQILESSNPKEIDEALENITTTITKPIN